MLKRRERIIETIKQRLLRKGLPRLQMSLILLLTGFGGFLASFSLLHLGLGWMWLRYPIAILFAYSVFLLLLRLWLSFQRPQTPGLSVDFDPSVIDINYSPSPVHSDGFKFSGGSGDAGGGGGGVSWGNSVTPTSSTPGSGSSSSGLSFDIDLEEGWLVVLAIVAILGGLLASLYVIYIAPALLAEILVDGVLVTGLYRQLKKVEQRHWLRAAIRRTLLPAILATILFTVAGYAMQRAVPAAHSIGEVWKHVVNS
ncbi:MAG: hypothetical protein H0X14_08725 [Acidobacteria bacterium]|nr:hypothetical protein [Acidobacteriota bacterium]